MLKYLIKLGIPESKLIGAFPKHSVFLDLHLGLCVLMGNVLLGDWEAHLLLRITVFLKAYVVLELLNFGPWPVFLSD